MPKATGSSKKKVSNAQVPAEIREYYQAEKRDRMWVVWLLSGATFIVTVLVVLGLFWGGRWTYHKIKGDNKPATQTATTEDKPAEQKQEQSKPQGTDSNSGASGTTNTTPAPSTSAPSTSATTPKTGPSASTLVNTGPTSDD
jgi:hypothetical protein